MPDPSVFSVPAYAAEVQGVVVWACVAAMVFRVMWPAVMGLAR